MVLSEQYCSYKHHTVLIIMQDNIGHMFCLMGTLQSLRIQYEHILVYT